MKNFGRNYLGKAIVKMPVEIVEEFEDLFELAQNLSTKISDEHQVVNVKIFKEILNYFYESRKNKIEIIENATNLSYNKIVGKALNSTTCDKLNLLKNNLCLEIDENVKGENVYFNMNFYT